MSLIIQDDSDFGSAQTDNDVDTVDKFSSSWAFDSSEIDKDYDDYNNLSLSGNLLSGSSKEEQHYFGNESSFDTLLTEMDNEDARQNYQNLFNVVSNEEFRKEPTQTGVVLDTMVLRQQQQALQYQRAQAKKLQLEIEIRELCAQNGGLPPTIHGLAQNNSSLTSPISVSRTLSNNINNQMGVLDLYSHSGAGVVKKGPSEADLAAFRQQIQSQEQQQPVSRFSNSKQQQQHQFAGFMYSNEFNNGSLQSGLPRGLSQQSNTCLSGFGLNNAGPRGSFQQHQPSHHQNSYNKGSIFQQPYGGGLAPHPPRHISASSMQPQPLLGGGFPQQHHQQGLQQQGMSPAAVPASYNGAVYQVQFKQAHRDYILGPRAPPTLAVGDFVMVECDRGEDLGVVTGVSRMSEFVERRYRSKLSLEDEASEVGRILRHATLFERQQLPEKYHDEQNVFQVTSQLSTHTFKLPMRVVDAEYRFDRKKLTIYYVSDMRIDFRELVRDLFSAYRTRIWMKKVSPAQPFAPLDFAAMSLSSGVHFGAGSTTSTPTSSK